MFYFIIYLILSACSVRYVNIPRSNSRYRITLFFILLGFILISGLRYEIGVDYFNYVRHFNESETIYELLSTNSSFLTNIFLGWEPGCILLFSFTKTFFKEPQSIFLISSLICSILLFKAMKYFNEDKYLFFSLLIYFCFVYMYQEMHALRQALGATIFYYGLTKNNSVKSMLIYTALSGCFHYSLWLFIPIVFFIKKTMARKLEFIILSSAVLVFFLRIPWMNGAINILASVSHEFGIISRIVGYTDNDEFSRPFFFTFILYLLPYLFLMYSKYKSKIVFDQKTNIAWNLYFLYLVFTMLFWEFSFFSIRYGWICLFGMAVILPRFIGIFKNKFIPISYIIVFSFLPIRTFLFPDLTTAQFSPYENYISRVILQNKGTGRERAIRYLSENGKSLKE